MCFLHEIAHSMSKTFYHLKFFIIINAKNTLLGFSLLLKLESQKVGKAINVLKKKIQKLDFCERDFDKNLIDPRLICLLECKSVNGRLTFYEN